MRDQSSSADVSGSSCISGLNYRLVVSNGNGYLAHIHCESTWHVAPSVLFQIFTYPSNSALFRDIKSIANREVVSSERGLKIVDVDQQGELKILWNTRLFTTRLRVTEDERDEAILKIKFELLSSDVLERFSGNWVLTPVLDESGTTIGCRGVLEQDVLPKGVPLFVQRLPFIGGLLRGVSLGAITRLMEDINLAVDFISKGLDEGVMVHQTLAERCGICSAERGFTHGKISSFQIDGDCFIPSDSDESEEVTTNACESDLSGRLLLIHIEVGLAGLVRLHLISPESVTSMALEAQA